MLLPAMLRRRAGTVLLATAVPLTLLGSTAPAVAEEPNEPWTVELAATDDDTNVRDFDDKLRLDRTDGDRARPASAEMDRAQGIMLAQVHHLDEAADRFAVEVDAERPAGATVAVDIRGLRADGTWTEWVAARPGAAARLIHGTRAVQPRLLLIAGRNDESPVVNELRVLPQDGEPAPEPEPEPEPAPDREAGPVPHSDTASYRVFATRIGLTGHTTANGHRILNRDHFVALPSRRGLSPRGSGDYTVKVCANTGRCEWAPVWDVGPWNTMDDHWNPSDARQMWGDLPRGLPQAQAAYQSGYNGGRDQFGRQVRNPAGIDLADGMFWDGLGLRNNGWVDVTYVWAGDGPMGRVNAGMLNVRTGPGKNHQVVGLAAGQARVELECWVTGEVATGREGTTDRWLRIGPDQFVSAAHIAHNRAIPGC